ncbi:MAG: efflux RND transporter periplasmic adaptor subunit [Thermoanaerobaculaceae bacterium]|nr:efflux RND transporter periplasmic adaptor subunit [Thermoanaerobaculaceae bacterium]
MGQRITFLYLRLTYVCTEAANNEGALLVPQGEGGAAEVGTGQDAGSELASRAGMEVPVKKWIVLAVVVLLLGAGAYGFLSRKSADGTSYRFVTVEKGDLESVVSATGALSAVKTVQVGTQISGLISKLNVDFNDKVVAGQVIAQLDTTLLETSIHDAEATLERNQAQLRQAERDFERIKTLHQQGISADADFNTAQYNLDVARASVKSANASLERARQNLAYATITAPVSGTVVERDVDVGQTVAASLSAPKLFLIANDLSEMQILASVDESDIGQIREGQSVRFTVKAYQDRKFTGTVKQVRLQSTVEQNVVNYTVVVAVSNPDGKLLPGMTATVEFVVASARDVLKVANAALRFRPSDAVVAEVRARLQKEREARMQAGEGGASGHQGMPGGEAGPGGPGMGSPGNTNGRPVSSASGARPANGNGKPRELTLLYHLDTDGKITGAPVRTGITDGQYTEVRGRALEAGLQVIAGATQVAKAASANPFQAASGDRRGPPGGF